MPEHNAPAGSQPAGAALSEQKTSADAAEREGSNEPIIVEHEGLTFTLPPDLPFNMMRDIGVAENDGQLFTMVLETLLGPEQLQKVWDANLGLRSGMALIDKMLDNYGTSLGKL